ncbi:MAG: hypothetical protein WCF84_03150 [Anaerolineae bacterium]
MGIAIVLGLRFGLKAIFPIMDVFDMLRYAIIGVWISLGAPWLFMTLHLASAEVNRAAASVIRAQASTLPH